MIVALATRKTITLVAALCCIPFHDSETKSWAGSPYCVPLIELVYDTSGFGRDDLCCLCAQENAAVDQNLKSKFLTVLPICGFFCQSGKEFIVARAFTKWLFSLYSDGPLQRKYGFWLYMP